MREHRNWLPDFIKPFLRFVHYSQERRKFFREIKIRRIQNERIKKVDAAARRLIIFFVPGADYDTGFDKISGGAISIVSLTEESRKLREVHGAEVVMCTFPGQHLLAKHTQFRNETDVFRYDQLESYFLNVTELLVQIPEFMCVHFNQLQAHGSVAWLVKNDRLHINILNQNIRFMPGVQDIDVMKSYSTLVTATTAHQQYCTPYYRDLYKISLHKFSVWISPEKYSFKTYQEKRNLMIVSPDAHPEKEAILTMLKSVPELQLQIIQNLTYEQYKETIANAKWTLTFGEGLDGYLIEPIFSGAVGFAVYNDEFFTEDFAALPTLYPSIKSLREGIIADIGKFDAEPAFSIYQKQQFELCARYYSEDEYKRNIISFYRKEYTHPYTASKKQGGINLLVKYQI